MMNGFGLFGGWMAGLTFGIISSIVMIPIMALFLWLTTKLFKPKDQTFISALIVSAILGAVNLFSSFFSYIPFIGWLFSILSFFVMIALGIFLIKWRYHVEWGKAILIWLVWALLTLFVFGIFAAILAVLIAVLGIGAGMMNGMFGGMLGMMS